MEKLLVAIIGLTSAIMISPTANAATADVAALGLPGTPKQSSECDSNYSGCVPVASDVDCAGGSGNGPAYVQGPVKVIGIDIYELDRNGTGIGCEPK